MPGRESDNTCIGPYRRAAKAQLFENSMSAANPDPRRDLALLKPRCGRFGEAGFPCLIGLFNEFSHILTGSNSRIF
jgi:hypothetical protein